MPIAGIVNPVWEAAAVRCDYRRYERQDYRSEGSMYGPDHQSKPDNESDMLPRYTGRK
jgi:hypothetical protein